MSAKIKFPHVVKHGSVHVMIYRIKPGCSNEHYTICYHQAGQRHRRSFSDLDKAIAEAELAAKKLDEGELAVLKLTGADRQSYLAAVANLGDVGVPIEPATREYAVAHKMLAGYPLLEAIRFFKEYHDSRFTPKKVREVLDEMLEIKQKNDLDPVYIKDLRLRGSTFAADFNCEIHTVTTAAMEKWLASLEVVGYTKNKYRAILGTLFNFAKKRHYLPKNHPGISEVDKAPQETSEPEVFTPDEMLHLLNVARPEIVPFLAVASFAGVRHDENKRLDWSAFDFDQNHIRITAKVAKMGFPRVIPLLESLKLWLLPYRKPRGPITPFANMSKQLCQLGKSAGVTWRHNALRHSYASYRLAQTHDAAKVAFECGNSPRMISTNYYKLVTPADAERWFNIRPDQNANVVPMVS